MYETRNNPVYFSFLSPGTIRPAFAESEIESRFRTLEETLKKQEETIKAQQIMINELKEQNKKNEVKQMNSSSQPEGAATEQTAPAGEMQQQVQELKEKIDQVVEAQRKVLPSEFNPSIGLVGETIFSYRDKGSSQTGSGRPGGFDVFQRSVELNAAAAVDPYAKAYVVINASADPVTGESSLGVEEAALQTTSLPWNSGAEGRAVLRRVRPTGVYSRPRTAVCQPSAGACEYIGGESRTDGLQINWLLPVDHYVSLTVGVGDQFGGDNPPNNVGDFRNGSGLNYWGRLSTYFDLTPDISLEPGISALWNPSTDAQWASTLAVLILRCLL